MGFPYTFQFLGSENNKWRLVGNAVCISVSSAFAKNLKKELNLKVPKTPIITLKPNLSGVYNLNSFQEKTFDNPPKRKRNSRFRRHPFKDGNLTVSLTNYDIIKNNQPKNKWYTSIQYGTGEGFPTQKIRNNFYKKIEPIIEKYEEGKDFLNIINNGFSEKIGKAVILQKNYENQVSCCSVSNPTELIEEIAYIINQINISDKYFEQNGTIIFKHKKKVPLKQLFALYAVNKISSVANKK